MKKAKIYLSEDEWSLLIYTLNAFRNKLIGQGRYTDVVDETMLKLMDAPRKKKKAA